MRPTSEQGFTLFEILIGLAISSLVMVGLSLAMKTINMGFDQATETIGRQGTLATGLGILSGDFSRIERTLDDPDKPTRYMFLGSPEEAIYVMAERPGNNHNGLYWVRLLARNSKTGSELVRTRSPYAGDENDFTAIQWTDEVVLLRGDFLVQFSYRNPRIGLREWANSWQAGNILPSQIKIEITDTGTGRLRVPAFVQTLKIGAEADCVSKEAQTCSLNSNGQLVASGEKQKQ